MNLTSPSTSEGGGDRLLALVSAVHRLSRARSLPEIKFIVSQIARHLSGADGATFILREHGDVCFHVDEDAIAPLWEGQRFEMTKCISGWAMLHHESVAIADIYTDDRIVLDDYRETFVKSMLMTPIRLRDPIGAIGLYWATPHAPTDDEIGIMRVLAESTGVALESAEIWRDIETRTAELADTNTTLGREVIDLRQAEEEASQLAITDELTGLYNHRGFVLLAGKSLALVPRAGSRVQVVMADIDGLKAVNDALGHAPGSAMIVAAAKVLRRSFRAADIIARIGGDEFAVFVPGADNPDAIAARIEAQTREANQHDQLPACLSLSVGVTESIQEGAASMDDLLRDADAAMYRHKQAKRQGGAPSAHGAPA